MMRIPWNNLANGLWDSACSKRPLLSSHFSQLGHFSNAATLKMISSIAQWQALTPACSQCLPQVQCPLSLPCRPWSGDKAARRRQLKFALTMTTNASIWVLSVLMIIQRITAPVVLSYLQLYQGFSFYDESNWLRPQDLFGFSVTRELPVWFTSSLLITYMRVKGYDAVWSQWEMRGPPTSNESPSTKSFVGVC